MHWKPTAAVLGAAAGAGAVIAGVRAGVPHAVRRRVRQRGGTGAEPPPAREPWQCACGAQYLVAGLDRHRVYWPTGAAEADPLLADRCPECDRPLPAEHAVAAPATI